MRTAIVLLSGGQDSTTSLYIARLLYDHIITVSYDYGQRHRAELDAAREIAALAGVPNRRVAIPALQSDQSSALINPARLLQPTGGNRDRHAPQGLPTSFVYGRNLIFLSTLLPILGEEGAHDIVAGLCEEDYSGYPDCRREFVDAFERVASLAIPSSRGPVRVLTPLMHATKAQSVRIARRLNGCWDALAITISCYRGRRPGCGECPACLLRAKGFKEAGEEDPAERT